MPISAKFDGQSAFLSSLQLPNHVHKLLLVGSLYQPVSLGVVGCSLQSLNAEDLTQFLNNAAGKTSTSVTQEPGQGSKDRDKASI